MMLDALRNGAHGWEMNPEMSVEELAIRASVNKGYTICLEEFEKLAQPISKPQTVLMSDFSRENRFDAEEESHNL